MRTSILLLATLLPVGAAQALAQATDEFVARETAVWQAVKDKQLDAFTAALDTSVVGVYADGSILVLLRWRPSARRICAVSP